MKDFSLREFKPAIFFLLKFLGIYLTGNLLYGLYITHYEPQGDPITQWVTWQTSVLLKITGHETQLLDGINKPTTSLIYNRHEIVSVYEGCNGVNVVIIFVAFVFAFGPYIKKMTAFILAGVFIIHICNLLRIAGLFLISIYAPNFLYFTHKYLFTAFLYAIVFILWLWWIRSVSLKQKHK
jgi:exosortase family protein XrtF